MIPKTGSINLVDNNSDGYYEYVFIEEYFSIVAEKYSTEKAKTLYWELFPPEGWRRLIPLGLQTPPEPLDGYAAVVQVRHFLEQADRGAGEAGPPGDHIPEPGRKP